MIQAEGFDAEETEAVDLEEMLFQHVPPLRGHAEAGAGTSGTLLWEAPG